MTVLQELLARLASREARIGVVGLGYVGFPVAVSFAEAGFSVVGIDLDESRVAAIEEGRSFLRDVSDEVTAALRKTGRLRASVSFDDLSDADAVLLCVPTPLTDGAPDLSYVLAGAQSVAQVLKPGTLVVLESTTYPGTTEELLAPLFEARGLTVGDNFFLAFSPERIDPGNDAVSFRELPKVVGGLDQDSTQAAAALYQQVVPKVFPVSGAKEAELAKLIENTFRHVNIALVNELAVYAHELGIDIWEAIEAAATKPFGFMPFWPGPGWGGHCIPLDPAYLSYRVRRQRAHDVRFVELAHAVNSEMPRYVVERATLLLNERGKAVNGARILGIGVAYKGGTEDTRGSPGKKVLEMMLQRNADVLYHDPLIPHLELGDHKLSSTELNDDLLKGVDLVLILAPQHEVDWEVVARTETAVFDCCNALGGKGAAIRL
ncbi:MAG: nucleotide sugar dehydrogenase [Actinomycetota bacterium]|nr:nucleotide sugar dehydrogenase [Actinomycetota bacterium]